MAIGNLAIMHHSPAEQRDLLVDGTAVLNALPVPAAVLDRNGVIRSVNEAWKRLSPPAMEPGALYGRLCERCFETGTHGRAALEAGIREVISGKTGAFVTELQSGGGRLQVTVAPLQPGICALVTHTAIAMAPAPENGEPDQRQRQAEKMEAMGRLVGGVAHDFANLLTMISGYSEIVLNRMSPGEPLRPELEEIRKAANRGSRLTAQLLGFTRGEAVQPRILDLNILIADMENMLRPIIGEYIDLTTALSGDLGKIKADPGQMEQVIMNLVLNARDAMPRGGRITIETANVELSAADAAAHEVPPGPYVILSFADTGQGMDAQTMSHLFEPFFTTKEKGKGTGLGLSTVYSIVKQNRGDVWAHSVPGQGTTFTICLPHAEAHAAAADAPAGARASARGTETILLVEDEDGVRRLLKHILMRQGYTVLEARDGDDALELLGRHDGPIDLLLTDMVMPRMSGREIAERFLALRPGKKVIYMSGYTDDVLMRTGALGPGMSFLQKPLKPETISAKVRDVLDGPAPRPGGNGAGEHRAK